MLLGIGTDIIEIDRIQQAIEKNEKFLNYVFTEKEQSYCKRKGNPWQSFAARFSAKEAVSKALGVGLGRVKFTEIEILNTSKGQPYVVLYGNAEALAKKQCVAHVYISLSHSKCYAIATAVLEGE